MKQKWKTTVLTKMALLVTLLSISSYISIPLPFTAITITAQTLIINLIGLLLSPGQAACTMGTWVLIGLAGLPVFSGGAGGAAKLFGPTGGFIFGAFICVVLLALFKGKGFHFLRFCLLTICLGMPVMYLFGASYMKYTLGLDWGSILVTSILPFLPLDILKCILASYLAKPLLRLKEK